MIILAAFEPGIFFLLLWGLFSWLTSRKKKKKIDTDSSTVIHKPKVDIITRLQKLQDNISQEFEIFPSESKSAEDLEEYLADEFDFEEPEIVKSDPVVIEEEIEESIIDTDFPKPLPTHHRGIKNALYQKLELRKLIILKEILGEPRSIKPYADDYV